MTAIAIDTCFAACSVAIRTDNGAVHALCDLIGRGHAERVIAMVGETAALAGVALRSVSDVIVTVGPGTFTGQRVGVACAQGLALAAGARCHAAGALHAIAATVARQRSRGEARSDGRDRSGRRLGIVAGAGRDAYYWQIFDPELRPEMEAVRVDASALSDTLAGFDGDVAGPAAGDLLKMEAGVGLAGPAHIAADWPSVAEARDLLDLYAAGCLAPVTHLRPCYLRKPDAEPSRDVLMRQPTP